jgi:beta-galactosidase GanA
MRWNPRSFSIGGQDLILIGGSMHYSRVPPEEWEGTLRRMHADGFNVVDTVIPWSLDEAEEDKVDFSSLQRFFDLAGKYGLYIVARPGPYICAEFDQGGYSRWLSGKGINFRSDTAASRHSSRRG